ncbi:hypothetical protein [uncultured Sphingomonas sp.]|uniref:hypothetical protein n=1 Tax=uncultured Sphingomonas sp. TaxID=158754 RepID=UPI00374A263F
MFVNHSNREKAAAAWAPEPPAWVKVLAEACDRTNQRAVADQLGKSGGYVSAASLPSSSRSSARTAPAAAVTVEGGMGSIVPLIM